VPKCIELLRSGAGKDASLAEGYDGEDVIDEA
jgi:hypothetical protein